MSETCDGDGKETIEKTDRVEECLQNVVPESLDSACADDFTPKTRFHGFEKKPVVVVRRIDIGPYLKIMKRAPGDSSSLGTTLNTNINWILPLGTPLGNCSVKLFNDDLFKLKAELISKAYDMFPYITCRICKKQYPDEKKLRNHQSTKHMIVYQAKPQKRVSFSDHVIVHELKEYHKCRKCTRIFEHYGTLKSHMKRDHKKRKCYICYHCNKSFVDRTIFKVHIKLHCDVCGELMPNKAKYIEHRRNTCRVVKMHHCRTCKKSFFHFMDLKDHSYEHIGTFFICDICKDQFETKCAVAHHLAFLHSAGRPLSLYEMRNCGVDRLYLCNFCEESSVEKDVIEQHVGKLADLTNKAMTGYKDYYFCDQCLKKFDKENDMLQHKWSHFLKTNNNEQSHPDKLLPENKDDKKIDEPRVSESIADSVKLPSYTASDELPLQLQPIVILKRLDLKSLEIQREKPIGPVVNFVDIDKLDEKEYYVREGFILREALPDKAVVDPKSKKTVMSKHQCPHCEKYYSTAYCLRRHIQCLHLDMDNLQCNVCEETFFWPSLLLNHRCIRASEPEIPFDDARPEIHFDNLNMNLGTPELDDLNLDDDYPMQCVDFEVPAPVVQLTEYENNYVIPDRSFGGFTAQTNPISGLMHGSNLMMPSNGTSCAVYGTQPNLASSGMMNGSGFIDGNVLREGNAIVNSDKTARMPTKNNNVSYKIVVQEVPIEF